MKTLVIHPTDSTTDILCDIYRKHQDWSVIRHFPGQKVLNKLIQCHDRIIILSHGASDGMGDIKTSTYWIDCDSVQYLKQKEVIGVWCYASDFFRKYKLKGFATGMFISEMDEAYTNCVNCTEEDIIESNELFADLVGGFYDKYDSIIEYYTSRNNKFGFKGGNKINPVTEFNKELLEIFF